MTTYHKSLLWIVKRVLLVFFSIFLLVDGGANADFDPLDEGISVLLYHRVGEEQKYPTTSVSKEQFIAHLDYIQSSGFEVVHLDEAISSMGGGKKRVAITFDDGFLSIMEHAWKELEKRSMPFTVFVNSSSHEKKWADYMTWDMIRTMLKGGFARLGSHGWTHESMLGMSDSELKGAIEQDKAMIQERTGIVPTLLSYPYGEVRADQQEIVRSLGFEGAFGQHSGVASKAEDRHFLPRFSMNFRYGSLDRLRSALQSLPLPLRVMFPLTRMVGVGNRGLVLNVSMPIDGDLQCYGNGSILKNSLSADKLRLLVQLVDDVGTNRRYRVNCTVPHENRRGHFRWKGLVLFGE